MEHWYQVVNDRGEIEGPIMITSYFGKLFCTFVNNFIGKFSPKDTISDLTRPLQTNQVGTESENIFLEKK